MDCLQYSPGCDLARMHHEINLACEKENTVIVVPTIITFAGQEDDLKLVNLYSTNKLSSIVADYLRAHEGITTDNKATLFLHDGLVFLFLGPEKGKLEVPAVLNAKVEGSC